MASLASEVKIANLALTSLGADRIIALDEDSENARKVNAVFDLIRDEVLRAHVWNFALERREFGQLATAPLYEYSYAYQIPGDVLRIRKSETGYEVFVIEGDQVLTNEGTFNCLCIVRVTDVTKWTTDFVTAFAARLAAELAYSIADSNSLAQQKWDEYKMKIRQVRASGAQEGSQVELQANEWLEARSSGQNYPLAGA